jgi:hypothetical protein
MSDWDSITSRAYHRLYPGKGIGWVEGVVYFPSKKVEWKWRAYPTFSSRFLANGTASSKEEAMDIVDDIFSLIEEER